MIKGYGETINWDMGEFTWKDARGVIKNSGGGYVHLRRTLSFEKISEEKFIAKVMFVILAIMAIIVYVVHKNAPSYAVIPGFMLGFSGIAMACRLYYGYKKRRDIKKDEETRGNPLLKSLLLKDKVIINENVTAIEDRSKTRLNTSYKKPIQISPMAMSAIEMAEVKYLPGSVPENQ